MSRFLSEKYQKLVAYTPGEQPQDRAYIKLNTNESPYPPSPLVAEAVTGAALSDLRLYSDPEGRRLKEKLAGLYGIAASQVFLSNGSDDILNFAFMAYGDHGAAFPDISYSFYPVFAALHGVPCQVVPLREDFSLAPEDYENSGKLLLIANPNAPTGIALNREQIRRILESNPHSVVVIDEAYVDFGAESALPLLSEFSNLLVVMTFSKSRSMAGARLGVGFSSPEIIEDLEKLKYSTNPYNVNSITMVMGCAAVEADGYFRENCRKIMETREETAKALTALGFEILPSKANFLFLRKAGFGGKELYGKLRERGVLIRHFDKPRIADFIRVTIGTPAQMEIFLRALGEILVEKGVSS